MNFHLVEGKYESIAIDELSDFERDYLNSELNSTEVREKYGLSRKQYSLITQRIRDKYGLLRKPYAQSKHFYQQGNRWHIIKTIKNKRIRFGSLPADVFSKEDMEIIIEKCKKMQWNVDKCMNLIESLGGNSNE